MADKQPDAAVVALSAEELRVRKTQVETGRVRVRTVVDEEPVTVDETLRHERVEIERVAIDQEVDHLPSLREEGDILVIPVCEERLVVEKRLFVVEEVRVRRVAVDEQVELPTTLRRMRAVVEREDTSTGGQ